MLTQEQVLAAVQKGRESRCLDHRDYARLIRFFPAEQRPLFGFTLEPGTSPPPGLAWKRETIVQQMLADAAFGEARAKAGQGFVTSMMMPVVLMWLWILEEDLLNYADEDTDAVSFFRNVRAAFAPAVSIAGAV
jgi:hypothetical protein